MTSLALAFQNRTVVSGWHFDGFSADGFQRYHGPAGWNAVPVSSRGRFVGLAVFTDGVFIGMVKSAAELP
jgi:hypothetical protein